MSDPPGTLWLRQNTQNAQRDADLAARGQQQTQEIPYGPLKSKQQRLLPNQYGNLGAIRPLGPGEAVQMIDGGITSEETWTVQMPNGKWSVIPGLWLVNGVPTKVTEDQARQYAIQSKLNWPYTYDTLPEADAYAQQREAIWEKTPQALDMTTGQPALWAKP
jgi:hypothetical protein